MKTDFECGDIVCCKRSGNFAVVLRNCGFGSIIAAGQPIAEQTEIVCVWMFTNNAKLAGYRFRAKVDLRLIRRNTEDCSNG